MTLNEIVSPLAGQEDTEPGLGVASPKGFRASGVTAGIRKNPSKKDCALIVSDSPASVAGMFTTNVMKSPPVYWNIGVCEGGTARAVFINSGNANAATGARGEEDVKTTAGWLSAGLNIPANEVCICSTGVIGVPLPMDKIERGALDCCANLSREGSLDAALAIMTTDTVPKRIAATGETSGGVAYTIGGIAKGSGMICPNMATMIAILTTDAAIGPAALRELVREAVAVSFNQISIDNDMSTSDTVLVLANGQSGMAPLEPGTADHEAFGVLLTDSCRKLAKLLVKDGEGATKFVEVRVEGTATDDEAKRIARAIGTSQLCKTAFFGEDANWGRFACAAGYAGVDFDPNALTIRLGDVTLMEGGLVAEYSEEAATAIMKAAEFAVLVRVGGGSGQAVFWTSDLSHEYVSINADYRT